MYLREVVSPRKRGPDARYLQLVEGERDSQGRVLDLEPVQHRTPERISSHVHICVLAYLLVRLAENRTQLGWDQIRERVERISLAELSAGRASILQTTSLAREEQDLLNCCKVPLPPKVLQVTSQ